MEGKTTYEMEKAGGRDFLSERGRKEILYFIDSKMPLTIEFTYIKMIEICILEFIQYGD